MHVTDLGIVMPAKDLQRAKTTGNPQACDELSSARHRLRDCHRDHPITLFEGSSGNFCDRGRDVDLEALCVDGLF